MRAIKAEKERRRLEAERERVERDADRIRERCTTLAGFFREAWPVLEPNAPLVWNWHLDALCEHLEAISRGQINRLLANVPPGTSKSMAVSVMWQAWEWTQPHLRSMRYLATAFNDGPVKRDTRKCRDLILSEWYRTLWPEVKLVRAGETSFANANTGTREGLAFGSLTSQRGNRLIIDDPHSTETAESPTERARTTRRFREGALNRLNDQQRDAIVVIMQRLHEQDVSGTILSLGMDYVHLCLPMEFERERRCVTRIGFKDPRENEGDLLDPVRFPRAEVEALKVEMGAYAYAGQYQQRPAPREGGLFKPDQILTIDAIPAGNIQWVRGWDLASTTDGDWSAGLKLGKLPDGRFVIADVRRLRVGPDQRDAAIVNTASADGRPVRISLPQDPGQAGKTQVLYLTRSLAGYRVSSSPESGDKITRAEPFAAQVNVGNVMMLRGEWNEAFIDELRVFPNGTHDDQVDAASRAFMELLSMPALKISKDVLRRSAIGGRR